MSFRVNAFPDMTRSDAAVALFDTWHAGTRERQRATVNAITAAWEARASAYKANNALEEEYGAQDRRDSRDRRFPGGLVTHLKGGRGDGEGSHRCP